MSFRQALISISVVVALAGCGSSGNAPRAVDAGPATNDDGTVTTATVTARFDPSNGVVPLPNNLLFSGTTDLTLNIPVADPTSASAGPTLALNALDGWSTTSNWVANFSTNLDASTVTTGGSVRVFEVSLTQPAGGVTGIERELTPGVEYVAVVNDGASADDVVIVPLQPLDQLTSYMAVLTRAISDSAGNSATPDTTYFIAQRTAPLIDANGNSTDPLLSTATAQALEPLRQLVNAQEAAAASQGIDPANIVVSWVATTQSVTPVLSAVRSLTQPQFSQLAPTGLTTAAIGAPGIADIYIGVMNLPYYLDAPSANDPTAPLTTNWEANPGGYVPPFNQFGLDPTSTNVTLYNPIPVTKSTQTVPVVLTLPNAGSGQVQPDSGWPVVIFQHGITRNRTDALAIADSMALAGFAVVSIDQPLHGIASEVDPATGTVVGPANNPFYIENTPFGAIANERTFDVDYIDNLTGAPGPDGNIDSSGAHTINLASLLTSRDNLRQASADLAVVAATVPTMDINGDGVPDFDGSRTQFVGQSLGSIVGTAFLGADGLSEDPRVNSATLSVPGGGIVGLLLGSPTFAPRILAGLSAAGIEQGTADFNSFVFAAQTVLDSADPVNWGEFASLTKPILVQEVIGSGSSLPDQVIPNAVPGFPLSGTEPLIAVMGLDPITSTTQDSMGVRGVTRFISGDHGSLLSPAADPAVTAEMQGEAASMAATNGTTVQVTVPSVLQGGQ